MISIQPILIGLPKLFYFERLTESTLDSFEVKGYFRQRIKDSSFKSDENYK